MNDDDDDVVTIVPPVCRRVLLLVCFFLFLFFCDELRFFRSQECRTTAVCCKVLYSHNLDI